MIIILDNGANYSDHEIAFVRCATGGEVDLVRAYVRLANACGYNYRNHWRSVVEISDEESVKVVDPAFPVSAVDFVGHEHRWLDVPNDVAVASVANTLATAVFALYMERPSLAGKPVPHWLTELMGACNGVIVEHERRAQAGAGT